jgi:acyl homoserine lactone synthase
MCLACEYKMKYEYSVLKFAENSNRWNLVVDFLKLRREQFLEDLGWDLYAVDRMEFEQYDTFSATYILCHVGDVVYGGVRILSTGCSPTVSNVYTYMINDAHQGLLSNIPKNICHDAPPIDDDIYEVSRFVVRKGHNVGDQIIDIGIRYLESINAKSALFLGWPAFMRYAKRRGYNCQVLGDVITGEDKRKYLAFSVDFPDYDSDLIVEYPKYRLEQFRVDQMMRAADHSGLSLDLLLALSRDFDERAILTLSGNCASMPRYMKSIVNPSFTHMISASSGSGRLLPSSQLE